jgi:hypothetical protein
MDHCVGLIACCSVAVELNLNGLPNGAIHVSGFSGEDGGFVKLNVVSQVNGVFSYG